MSLISKMVVLKNNIFGQKSSTYSKETNVFCEYIQWITVRPKLGLVLKVKKMFLSKNGLLNFFNEKSIFDVKNLFWKYNFGTFRINCHSLKESLKKIPLSVVVGQKSCSLGPTIFEILQPNWYYSK